MSLFHICISCVIVSSFFINCPSASAAISLDSTFGTDGKVIIDFGTDPGRSSEAYFVHRQSSGRLVISGLHAYPVPIASTVGIALAGLTDSGSLDPGFGINGKVVDISEGAFRQLIDLKVLPDGKTLRLRSQITGSSISQRLNRYTESGAVDNAFFADLNTFGNFARPVAMSIRTDGKINVLIRGGTATTWWLVRLNANGMRDSSFGTDGALMVNLSRLGSFSVLGMDTLPDGRILLSGSASNLGGPSGSNIAWVARLDEQGKFDRRFGQQGISRRLFENGNSIRIVRSLLQPDGKMLMVGMVRSSGGDSDFLLMRFTTRGRPDVDFGNIGMVTHGIGPVGSFESASSVALMSDGRIIVGGSYAQDFESPTSFAVVRYSVNGVPQDQTTTNFEPGARADAINILVQSDNKIVAVGSTRNPDKQVNGGVFAVARFVQSL